MDLLLDRSSKIPYSEKKHLRKQTHLNSVKGSAKLTRLKDDLLTLKNPENTATLSRFFKTGKGDYGEDDLFLGITVPEQRKIAKEYHDLSLRDLKMLLSSRIHEYRLVALLILTIKYRKADRTGKQEIAEFYLVNRAGVNNWDLVDLSAANILGEDLLDRERSILYKMALSANLWDRRIAVLSTFAFIKRDQFKDSLAIAELLLSDTHDLIHKAVGWMLREIGKRDLKVEERFLQRHCRKMPRTMLRYAIERFEQDKRKDYLKR